MKKKRRGSPLTWVLDLAGLAALFLVGFGIWQLSPPAAYIFAGASLLTLSVAGAYLWGS